MGQFNLIVSSLGWSLLMRPIDNRGQSKRRGDGKILLPSRITHFRSLLVGNAIIALIEK